MAGLKPLHPTIINHTFANVNTEETIVLPENTVDVTLRLRDTTKLVKVAVVSGESGTNFFTLDADVPVLQLEDVFFSSITLFVQTPGTLPVIVEVLALR